MRDMNIEVRRGGRPAMVGRFALENAPGERYLLRFPRVDAS